MSSDPIEVLRRMVEKLAAHVRPTCDELWEEAHAALASLSAPKPESAEAVAWVRPSALAAMNRCRNDDVNGCVDVWIRPDGEHTIPLYTSPPRPEASESWHAALDSASELASNAPDDRYRKRAEQVRDWIRTHPAAPQQASAPVGATLTNPWTGEPRDYRDVNSDPEGVLCVEPGAPLKAAPTAPVGVENKETALTGVLEWVRNKRTLLSARMSAGGFHAQEALDMTMLSRLEHFLAQQPAAPVGVEDLSRWSECGPRTNGGMRTDPEGEWVRYEDVAALAQQPAAVDCSLPSEAPVDEVMVRTVAKAINAELEGDENIVLAWKRLGSNERKLRDRMARAAIAALAAQQGGSDNDR